MTDRDKAWNWRGSPWKTRSSYFTWIRGGIRRGLWNKSPVKLEFLNTNRYRIPNPNPKGVKRFPEVWGAKCSICNGEFTVANIEVDHIKGNHSLITFEDISTFIEAIVTITPEDLRLVCKPCHKIESYAEKQGISFKESQAIKEAIEIMKSKKDKEWLTERGITPESNQAKRRKQVEDYLLNRKDH